MEQQITTEIEEEKESNSMSDLTYITDPAEKEAFRLELKSIMEIKNFPDNLQNIHTPYWLCYEQIDKLERYTSLLDKDFLVFNLEYVEVLLYDFGIKKDRIFFVTDCKEKMAITKHKRYNGINVEIVDFKKRIEKMKFPKKFDVVIGNPPYQSKSNKDFKKTQPIWDKFVILAYNLTKENGFVSLIHPAGWRNVDGRFEDVKKVLCSKQMKYLEIHDIKDGLKTFGAGTRYDWYIATNSIAKEEAVVKGEDGILRQINLSKINFIPNGRLDEILKLLAKGKNETCEVIYSRSSYGSDKSNMSATQSNSFKYSCVQHVSAKDNKPSCFHYSDTKDKGHFNIPKIIFGRQCSGVLIDKKGEYGMCQDCAAIVDDPENLEKIQKAMLSEKFIELMKMCDVGGNGDRYNRKAIALFKKDFWKEFI